MGTLGGTKVETISIGGCAAYPGATQRRSAGHQRLVLYSALDMIKCMRSNGGDPIYPGLADARRPVMVYASSVHGGDRSSWCETGKIYFTMSHRRGCCLRGLQAQLAKGRKGHGDEALRTVDQLDDVANDAHNEEADADGLRDLDEFPLERVSHQ